MSRRLASCVEAWPECSDGEYDPRCCRFPKSCSCAIYDEELAEDSAPRIREIRESLGHWPACACLGPGPESVPGECNCQTQIRKLREELAGLLRPVAEPGDDTKTGTA